MSTFDDGGAVDASDHSTGARPAFLAAGALGLVLVVGAVIVVARLLGGGGQQAAEVLPEDTIAYLGIDLDPPGNQKFEAYLFFRAFPDAREEIEGGEGESDLRAAVVAEVVEDLDCPGVRAESVESWLGSRIAFAARRDGETISPSMIVQVEDTEAATADLERIGPCLDSGADAEPDAYGVAFSGDYAVLTPSQAEADAAVDAGRRGSLAEDASFQEWMGRTGDDGILEAYVAPEAGQALGDFFREELGGFGEFAEGLSAQVPPDTGQEAAETFDEIGAVAMTLRFEDKTLELSTAVAAEADPGPEGTLIGMLPETAEVAVAGNLPEGWAQEAIDRIGEQIGDFVPVSALLRDFAGETGLQVPEDLETLLGERTALAVSSGVVEAVEAAEESGNAVDIPVGVLAEGDPAAIEDVVDKLVALGEQNGGEVSSATREDRVAFGLSQAWVDDLATVDGLLGEDAAFEQVIPEGDDANAAVFLDLEGQIVRAIRAELSEADRSDYDSIVGPLAAFGASAVYDDGALVYRIRLGVD